MVLGKLDIHMQKNETYPTPFTKINSKSIKDSNVRPEAIKLPEENIGEKILDTGPGSDFLDKSPKRRKQKLK